MTELLESMLKDLSHYKGISKEDLLYKYIRERLNKSYNTYLSELDSSAKYLGRRTDKNVLKKMNNYDKRPKK
jgi:hypothetical protein